jgi:uncharacterized protein (DUF427 family)
VSLTVGTGPFGHQPKGRFNFERPDDVVYVEPYERRVRAILGGETVGDSRAMRLLHETGRLPRLFFPEVDVRLELVPGDAIERHPAVDAGVSLRWDAMDAWFEEDDELFGHVRDPYHRVEIRDASRRVRVVVGGEVVAESLRPIIVYETGLPPRYYLPREDVRVDLLEPHGKRTRCAYKGEASHWSVRAGGGLAEAVAWSYEQPDDDAVRLRGLVAFYNELVDLEVDGERLERPRTQWHPGGWDRGG